ncbi:MAG: zinc-dependent metalloprotease [Bacteroidota bacterium]|jgi:hypothetical protein
MKKHRLFFVTSLIIGQLHFLFGQQGENLFESAQILTPTQNEKLIKLFGKGPNRSMKTIRLINIDLSTAQNIQIELFDKKIEFFVIKKKIRSKNDVSWIGQSKENYKAYIVKQGEKVNASIFIGNEVFSIEPLGEGLHVIVKANEVKFKPEAEPLLPEENGFKDNLLNKGSKIESVLTDDIVYLDVLIAYTQSAANASGNITGMIQNAIDQANDAYIDSDINIRLSLTTSVQVSYNEFGGKSDQTILNDFTGTTDGNMDEIHQLRNENSADICFLLVNTDEVTGIAWLLGSSPIPSLAFGVAKYDYVRDNRTLAHEIGHIEGGKHDRITDPSSGYNHGYRYKPGAWRTIMAYDSVNSQGYPIGYYTRLNFWSNPNKDYPAGSGVPRGTTTYEDNSRRLTETRSTVANYRNYITIGTLSYNHIWRREVILTGNVYVPSGVTLTIETGTVVNFNGYTLTSTGGTINIQNGGRITLNPGIYLESGNSGNNYEVNGINVETSFNGIGQSIKAVPSGADAFVNWNDGSTANPRPIAGDINVNAIVKKHLTSTLQTPISTINQRKIAKDINNNYHLAYESGNKIWYTQSGDGGINWSAETLISQGGTAMTPSIATAATDWGDVSVFTVWQEQDANGKRLYIRRNPSDLATYTNILAIDNSDMQPVVVASTDGAKILVVYRGYTNTRLCYYYSSNYGETFSGGSIMSGGTPVAGISPSVAWDNYSGKFFISYTTYSNNEIRLMSYNGSMWTLEGSLWSGTVLSPSQVSVDVTGRQYITWLGYSSSYSTTAVCVISRSNAGVLSAVTQVVSDLDPPMKSSSISGNNGVTSGAALLFTDQSVRYTLAHNGSSWIWLYPWVSNNTSITLPEKFSSASVPLLYTTTTSSPHSLAFAKKDVSGAGLQKTSGITSIVEKYRGVEVRDTMANSSFTVLLGNLQVSSSREQLQHQELEFNSATHIRDKSFLQTTTLTSPNVGGKIIVKGMQWKKTLKFSVEVIDTSNGKIITSLLNRSFSTVPDSMIEIMLNGEISSFKNAVLALRIDESEFADSLHSIQNVEVSVVKNDKDGFKKNAFVETVAPEMYVLHQNYPNPFNPATTITYSLPEAGNVELVVYDYLGREVTRLASEYKEAGKYNVTFDATELSSGIYFYKINSGEYTATKRMVVLK